MRQARADFAEVEDVQAGQLLQHLNVWETDLEVMVAREVQVRQLRCSCQRRGNAAEAVALQVQHLE